MVRNPSDHQISRVERPSVSHASGGSPPISPFAADAPITAPSVPAPPMVPQIHPNVDLLLGHLQTMPSSEVSFTS